MDIRLFSFPGSPFPRDSLENRLFEKWKVMPDFEQKHLWKLKTSYLYSSFNVAIIDNLMSNQLFNRIKPFLLIHFVDLLKVVKPNSVVFISCRRLLCCHVDGSVIIIWYRQLSWGLQRHPSGASLRRLDCNIIHLKSQGFNTYHKLFNIFTICNSYQSMLREPCCATLWEWHMLHFGVFWASPKCHSHKNSEMALSPQQENIQDIHICTGQRDLHKQ